MEQKNFGNDVARRGLFARCGLHRNSSIQLERQSQLYAWRGKLTKLPPRGDRGPLMICSEDRCVSICMVGLKAGCCASDIALHRDRSPLALHAREGPSEKIK